MLFITVGKINSSTGVNFSQEATANQFQQAKSKIFSLIFEDYSEKTYLKEEKGVACSERGKMAEGVVAKGGKTFFEGAKYSDKVLRQMNKADDIYHAFPKSVDGYATKFGQWSTRVGADGKVYLWLEMPGGYGGKIGTFEYIKDAGGIINHRFFYVP